MKLRSIVVGSGKKYGKEKMYASPPADTEEKLEPAVLSHQDILHNHDTTVCLLVTMRLFSKKTDVR